MKKIKRKYTCQYLYIVRFQVFRVKKEQNASAARFRLNNAQRTEHIQLQMFQRQSLYLFAEDVNRMIIFLMRQLPAIDIIFYIKQELRMLFPKKWLLRMNMMFESLVVVARPQRSPRSWNSIVVSVFIIYVILFSTEINNELSNGSLTLGP